MDSKPSLAAGSPRVTWVTLGSSCPITRPRARVSRTTGTGVVNAVMENDDWEHTAIFLTWDEWGGFYEHVPPPEVDDLGFGFPRPDARAQPVREEGLRRRRRGRVLEPASVRLGQLGLPYLTERIERTHNFEHTFAFERNPRTDAQPLPPIDHCYGKPSEYPGDTIPVARGDAARPEPFSSRQPLLVSPPR